MTSVETEPTLPEPTGIELITGQYSKLSREEEIAMLSAAAEVGVLVIPEGELTGEGAIYIDNEEPTSMDVGATYVVASWEGINTVATLKDEQDNLIFDPEVQGSQVWDRSISAFTRLDGLFEGQPISDVGFIFRATGERHRALREIVEIPNRRENAQPVREAVEAATEAGVAKAISVLKGEYEANDEDEPDPLIIEDDSGQPTINFKELVGDISHAGTMAAVDMPDEFRLPKADIAIISESVFSSDVTDPERRISLAGESARVMFSLLDKVAQHRRQSPQVNPDDATTIAERITDPNLAEFVIGDMTTPDGQSILEVGERSMQAFNAQRRAQAEANDEDMDEFIDYNFGDWIGMQIVLAMNIAGEHTASNTAAGGAYELLRNQEQLASLQERFNDLRDQRTAAGDDANAVRAVNRQINLLLTNATHEIVRTSSSVTTFRRQYMGEEPIEINGVSIPPNSRVVVHYPSAAFDKSKFGDDAQDFKIDREDSAHNVGFGGFVPHADGRIAEQGDHYCAGKPIAIAELRALLSELLEQNFFDEIELPDRDQLNEDFDRTQGLVLNLVERLAMRAKASEAAETETA